MTGNREAEDDATRHPESGRGCRAEGHAPVEDVAPAEDGAAAGDGSESSPAAGLPIRIRPAVLVVLAVGAVLAGSTFFFEPTVEMRYGIVGVIALLYFATKVRYWL